MLNGPLRGVFWMAISGLMFVCVTVFVKLTGSRIPAAESAFLRYALGLVLLVPMWREVRDNIPTRNLFVLFGIRGFVHSFGVTAWFFAMTVIPMADVTAMNYLTPVYVTLGAAVFLGERLALRRILAICVALLGALVILRPGFREVSIGHIAMLGTSICFAVSYLIAKGASGRTSPAVVVFMLSIFVTIGLAPMAWMVWIPPTWYEVGMLFAVACFATAGHYTMTMAFAAAPVAVTQPVTFLQLVWSVSLGIVLFGEPLDPWVVLGGGMIMAAISFMTWREAVAKKRSVTPAVNKATNF